MNFKKRVNGSWTDTTHYIHNTSTDTITTLPAVLYPTGTTATVGIKGNTVQTDIPSPSSPVDVDGVGDIINLFDKNATDTDNGYVDEYYLLDDDSENPQNAYFISEYIRVEETTIYTLFYGTTRGNVALCYYDSNKDYISGTRYWNRLPFTFTTPVNAKYIRFSAIRYINNKDIITINKGSEALPYIDYGQYGISISNGSTTTIVSLGETQSTRAVKKIVFDGTEDWTYSASGDKKRVFVRGFDRAQVALALCSHFDNTDFVSYPDSGKFAVNATSTNQSMIFGITDMAITSATDWTTYLAQQYTAGTPVTVWYVLATPETATINEPLMKIGDYADEVSDISIPVTAGANTLSVGTTVQPSEVTVNYKGWHPVQSVHEAENGQWD